MMGGIGLLLIAAGVLLIIYAVQGESPFALSNGRGMPWNEGPGGRGGPLGRPNPQEFTYEMPQGG